MVAKAQTPSRGFLCPNKCPASRTDQRPCYPTAMQENSGAVLLSQIHHPMLDVHCKRCGRRGRYRHSTLLERFGPDARLPDVASTLEDGCERKGQHGGCFVIFPALAQ